MGCWRAILRLSHFQQFFSVFQDADLQAFTVIRLSADDIAAWDDMRYWERRCNRENFFFRYEYECVPGKENALSIVPEMHLRQGDVLVLLGESTAM